MMGFRMATAEETQYGSPPSCQASAASADRRARRPADQPTGYKDRFWIPRFWDGIVPWGWFPLLARNRFRIAPRRWGMAILIGLISLVNFLLWVVQLALYGRRIARTQINDAPIFVIGHWRSGTTLLHELLVLDRRHTCLNTYDCFAPSHFLVSAWFFRPLIGLLMPKRRPIDNMAAGWDYPQEDEFALCNMGLPSPYLTIAFPNEPPQDQEYFELDRVTPEGRRRWKRGLFWLLKCLTVRDPRRIVLKSPPHTFRIKTLLEMFPDARFVHIIRDPYVVFPSTVSLWKRLYRDEGLQVPKGEGLEQHVFETFHRMYEVFERDRELIPRGRFCEVRYEDLVTGPIDQMGRVYEELGLGDFEVVRPALVGYFADKADYKTNRYETSPELRAEISRRWQAFFTRYGYAIES
jgi:omega-hydroxy-beta-dihydromenaquinone-9 sulfotransferase